jgi:hypothetical protein
MGELKIKCETGKVSDGHHTFDELYEHRCALFCALLKTSPALSWRANNHNDGTMFEGWFIAGMHLPTGDITYHLPVRMWEILDNVGIATSNKAPEWDGHTANNVVHRVEQWAESLHS